MNLVFKTFLLLQGASLAEKLDQRRESEDAQSVLNANMVKLESQRSLPARREIIKASAD